MYMYDIPLGYINGSTGSKAFKLLVFQGNP